VTGSNGQARSRSRLSLLIALLLAVWLGSRLAAPPPQRVAIGPAPSATTLSRLIEPTTSSSPAAAVALGCDPVDRLFARMLSGLTEAAITNAGIEPQDVRNAMAADRATLKRYLETLGFAADDAQLDALMGGQLAATNLGSPFVALGGCESPPSPSSRGR
jgi:hypothetical protein